MTPDWPDNRRTRRAKRGGTNAAGQTQVGNRCYVWINFPSQSCENIYTFVKCGRVAAFGRSAPLVDRVKVLFLFIRLPFYGSPRLGLSARLAGLLLCAFALSGPLKAETVATVEDLGQALADAVPGTEIILAPGNYGPLLLRGGGGTFDAPIVLRSANPDDPAVFDAMHLRDVQHMVLQDLSFDYVFANEDDADLRPFQVIKCKDIAIRDGLFDGDLGPVIAEGIDRLPTAFGLSVRDTQGFELSGSEIRLFLRGAVFAQSDDLTLQDNVVHSIRSDGLNFVAVQRVQIEGNTIRDFLRSPDLIDHSDMIQFWTAGSQTPSADIVIRDNVLNSGVGLYTQSIFMRNEVVDRGDAGAEMFYRNLLIEENVIINAHLHGISIGETDGLTIRNNTVVRNALSSGPEANPNLWTPQIRVAEASRNVQILRNAVARITGQKGQPDWTVAENLIIQDQRPNEPGFYDEVFMSARQSDPRALSSFVYAPGGPLDGTGIGAARLTTEVGEGPAPFEIGFHPLIRVIGDPALPGSFVFDAASNRFPDGIDPALASYRWTFDDGVTLTGAQVERMFDRPGKRRVELVMGMPDGQTFTARTAVVVAVPTVISFAPADGLSGWVDGDPVTLPLPEGVDPEAPLPIGEGIAPVTVLPEAMAGFFGANDFEIALRLRSTQGERGYGEIFRIHNNLIVTLTQRGLLDISFSTSGAATLRIRSQGRVMRGSDWHDLDLRYSATDGRLIARVNKVEVASGTTFGRVKPMEYWGLSLGNPFGKKKSFDGEVEALVLRANTESTGLAN